ncbi:MAG: hypothetical protein QOC55_2079, partial [Thermoleophilaceae bacterium]|nr:hypothetical protein [Thermoleophilaceae bacterium]
MDQLTDITSPGAAFREVAEQLPGLAIFDAQGLCVYANPRAAELFGAERESLLGRGWWRAMNPDDATAFDADWRAARAEGRSYERDFLLSTSAGERWLSVRVAPAADGCWLATLDDRTTEAEPCAQLAAREAEFRL